MATSNDKPGPRPDGYQPDGSYVVNMAGTNGTTTNKQSDDNTNAGTNNAAASTPMNINFGYERMLGQNSGTTLIDKLFPGARKENVLDYFSSYNYQVSLYVLNPNAQNYFIQTGLFPNQDQGQIAVIAQSGGINNTSELRALTNTGTIALGQEGLDYFIDNLEFTTVPATSGQSYVAVKDMTMKIIEPVGFSFINQVKLAAGKITDPSATSISNTTGGAPVFNNLFMIGVKFYGYDVNGQLVTAKSDIVQRFTNGLTNEDGVIERYIAVNIQSIQFKLDGNATVYTLSLQDRGSQVATGTVNGYIQQTNSVVAGTVAEALNGGAGSNEKGLMGMLNIFEQGKKDKNYVDIPVTYEVEFLDKNNKPDPDGPIASALLESNVVSQTAPMSSASTTTQANIKESARAVTYNTVKKTINFTAGVMAMDMIDSIISKSEYVTAALNTVNNQNVETLSAKSINKLKFEWYSINPVVTIKGFDSYTNNWAYHIKYQIKPYTIYYTTSLNVPKGSYTQYPGPFKLYNYVFTGENTEVLSFDMELNTQWYAPYSFSTNDNTVPKSRIADNQATASAQNGSQGDTTGVGINNSTVVAENVRASINTTYEQATCKIKIMGDPDYISSTFGIDRRTIDPIISYQIKTNPFDGQTLIEIIFNTATDYQDDGLLDVTDKVRFYTTSRPKKLGIKGLVCKIDNIVSTFSRGTFTQVITAAIIPETLLIVDEPENQTSDSGRPVDNKPNGGSREDPIDRARREAEEVAARDEINRAIDNANWNASGAQTQPNAVHADDDKEPPKPPDTSGATAPRPNEQNGSNNRIN
jgi:hypothetical protein